MNNHSGDQKRIAKNTIMLYIRMILIMFVYNSCGIKCVG